MSCLRLFACLALFTTSIAFAGNQYKFRVGAPAEVTVDLEMSAPGYDWGTEGREAPLATVTVDGGSPQNVTLYAGQLRFRYPLFLGAISSGEHSLAIAGTGFETYGAKFREVPVGDPFYAVLANAPVLFARRNTIGKFTDIPLVLYCERLKEDGHPLLQYTMIFSNEDGGTSTRALMARWGRTTDIEYLYKAFLDDSGKLLKATIQSRNHQEIEFDGKRDGAHPLLMPVTDNNMVAGGESSSIRYQIAPLLVDLTNHSREQVMDEAPLTYQVMAKELAREKKLRPFGAPDGEKISDPRNYLYIEYKATNTDGALGAQVLLKDATRLRSSSLGRLDYAIARNGWVRTTVELPPGTKPEQIAQIGFECLVAPPEKGQPIARSGSCRLESVSKAFLLNDADIPGPSVFSMGLPVEIPTGETAIFPR